MKRGRAEEEEQRQAPAFWYQHTGLVPIPEQFAHSHGIPQEWQSNDFVTAKASPERSCHSSSSSNNNSQQQQHRHQHHNHQHEGQHQNHNQKQQQQQQANLPNKHNQQQHHQKQQQQQQQQQQMVAAYSSSAGQRVMQGGEMMVQNFGPHVPNNGMGAIAAASSMTGRHPALLDIALENETLKQKLAESNNEVLRLSSMITFFTSTSGDQAPAQSTTREQNQQQQQKARSRYWTDDEQARFLEGVRRFGESNHKAIATVVGTRNLTQVRTHAQKYFKKIARTKGNGEREQDGKIATIPEDTASVNGAATREREKISLRDSAPVPGRDGQREARGGAGALAAAAAAAGAAGTSAAAAAAYVAAGAGSPDAESNSAGEGLGQCSNRGSSEETSTGKGSSEIPASLDSTRQGNGTSGNNSRGEGSDSNLSSVSRGMRRACQGDSSSSGGGGDAPSGGSSNSPRSYNNSEKNGSDNNSSSGGESKKGGSPVCEGSGSGSDDGTGSFDGRSQNSYGHTGFEFAEASPEAQAALQTS